MEITTFAVEKSSITSKTDFDMAKFFKLAEDNQQIIDDVFGDTGLDNYFNLITLGVKKSKQLVKVQKTQPITEYFGKMSEDNNVVLYLYEEAFDRLDVDTKKLLIEDAIAQISFDAEKAKIIIGAPSITITLGGRAKYGEKLADAAEAAVLAIQQIEDEKKGGE